MEAGYQESRISPTSGYLGIGRHLWAWTCVSASLTSRTPCILNNYCWFRGDSGTYVGSLGSLNVDLCQCMTVS